MKIVFVNLNSKYIHSSLAPWYLIEAIKNEKVPVECDIIESTINESVPRIITAIEESKPDIIGFCCYIWNINRVLELGEYIAKKNKSIKIWLGGPEVSYRAENILENYFFVDAVLCGEGEWIIPKLLRTLIDGGGMENLPGVCSKKGEKLYINEPVVSCEIPPNPYSKKYFETLNGRIVYFESSRGCPFSCAFCLSGRCGGVRYFPFEESSEVLIQLANSGTKTIKFVDRTFNANRIRTNRWLEFLIKERGVSIPENVCFHFEIAGDLLEEDTLDLLKSLPTGMVQLEIGLQSFNKETLEAVTRRTDIEKLKENIRKLISFKNIHIHLDLIMGLPYEDMVKIRKSFDEAFRLRPHMLQMGFLKLLHGAAMREEKEKYPCSYNSKAPYEVISTPWLSENELANLHRLEDSLERIYNSGRLIRTMDYMLEATQMDAFDFFMYVGKQMDENVYPGISLNEYEEKLFAEFLKIEGTDKLRLRDMMVLDRLETDPSGRLPGFLRVEDDNLRKLKKNLNKDITTAAKSGIKRGIAIIYSKNKAAYVDYIEKNPITGRYKLNYIELPLN